MAAAAATTNHTKLLKSECHTRRRWRHLAMNKCGFYTRAWTTASLECHVQAPRLRSPSFCLFCRFKQVRTFILLPILPCSFLRVFFFFFFQSTKYSIFIWFLPFPSHCSHSRFFPRRYSSEITSHCKHECRCKKKKKMLTVCGCCQCMRPNAKRKENRIMERTIFHTIIVRYVCA